MNGSSLATALGPKGQGLTSGAIIDCARDEHAWSSSFVCVHPGSRMSVCRCAASAVWNGSPLICVQLEFGDPQTIRLLNRSSGPQLGNHPPVAEPPMKALRKGIYEPCCA